MDKQFSSCVRRGARKSSDHFLHFRVDSESRTTLFLRICEISVAKRAEARCWRRRGGGGGDVSTLAGAFSKAAPASENQFHCCSNNSYPKARKPRRFEPYWIFSERKMAEVRRVEMSAPSHFERRALSLRKRHVLRVRFCPFTLGTGTESG